jgi:predicted unusual protein kinase regulating ubiquinone biosynthesis (AarF/ABC1/UbiB family)
LREQRAQEEPRQSKESPLSSEEKKTSEKEKTIENAKTSIASEENQATLDQIEAIPTSRLGRFLKAGWAARHAIPLALRRTMEIGADKEAKEATAEKQRSEKLLKQQEAIAQELFRTLGTLKGVAQKLGQMLSYLDGVLPSELAPIYQRALSQLQSSAPALPLEAIRRVVESELLRNLEDAFAFFSPHPFAAASVGQVHRARLHDGTEVVVKIQYPDVERAFESDLKNLKLFETMLSPLIRYYKAKDLIDQARQQLQDELDYQREAEAQLRFSTLFAGHSTIHIPRVFTELSSQRVLVTEWIAGMSFEQMRQAPEEKRRRAAITLFRYYWESLFHHYYVNADPHPGNYIFQEDGSIYFLDFGASTPVDPSFIRGFQENITAHMDGDEALFRESAARTYGFPTDDPIVFDAYCAVIQKFLEPMTPENQPFLFTSAWLESFFEDGFTRKNQILLRGGRIPRLPPPGFLPPDLLVLQRIGLGLSSLIARLGGCTDWTKEARSIFATAPR